MMGIVYFNENVKRTTTTKAILQMMAEEINTLTNLLERDILDMPYMDLKEAMNKKKEQYVLSIHRTKIQKQSDGRNGYIYASRPNGEKQYAKSRTYEGLIEKLYDFYTLGQASTLEKVYKDAVEYKSDCAGKSISGATLKRYDNSWKKFLEPYPIAKKELSKISLDDWQNHYEKLCTQHSLTRKQFSAVRDVVSMIMKYAVKKKIISHAVTSDIDYADLPYVKAPAYNNVKVNPLSSEQVDALLRWCASEMKKPRVHAQYLWAIVLNVTMGMRYAELFALKWENVDFNNQMVTVEAQMIADYQFDGEKNFVRQSYERVNHIKGYEDRRCLPMPKDAMVAFSAIKALGLSDEYVFPKGSFSYKTYSRRIKDAVEGIGLNRENYSTHSLRTTSATRLYKQSKDLYQVQTLLGHTNTEMTMKYIKDTERFETLKRTMLSDGYAENFADLCEPFESIKNPC